MAYVSEEDYAKFKQELLGDTPLGSLSCDELNERIRKWQDENGEDYRARDVDPEGHDGRLNKMKSKVRRQWKSEAKRFAREERGGVPFPVRVQEVDTPLSAVCKEGPEVDAEELENEVPHRPSIDGPEDGWVEEIELLAISEQDLFETWCVGLLTGVMISMVCVAAGVLLGLLL